MNSCHVFLVRIHSHGVSFMTMFLDMNRSPNIRYHVGTEGTQHLNQYFKHYTNSLFRQTFGFIANTCFNIHTSNAFSCAQLNRFALAPPPFPPTPFPWAFRLKAATEKARCQRCRCDGNRGLRFVFECIFFCTNESS